MLGSETVGAWSFYTLVVGVTSSLMLHLLAAESGTFSGGNFAYNAFNIGVGALPYDTGPFWGVWVAIPQLFFDYSQATSNNDPPDLPWTRSG